MKLIRAVSAKLTSLTKLELIIITVILLIIIFSSVYLLNDFLWNRYIDKAFSPFLANDKIEFAYESDGWTHYNYSDYENGYFVQVGIPPYLHYGGMVSVSMQFKDYETGIFRGHIMVFHSNFRINQKIVLSLGEQTAAHSSYRMGSAVDRYGKPLGRNPADSEDFYRQWLALYDKYYDEAMEVLRYFKDFFGEDVLQ